MLSFLLGGVLVKLQSQFNLQVAQSNWWKSNEPIVIAVSTGVDSMVLLHLIQQLKQYHPQITVAHVNHQLRKQSEDEEQYLRDYCNEHQLQLVVKRWEHGKISSGMEAQARKFRYQFFKEVMQKTGSKVLVTAHQQNDQAETVLMKLVRSGNLKEVAGIKPVRKLAGGKLIRPLLKVRRSEIESYAITNQIHWFEDETNHDDEVQRNRIRHHVLPNLVEENKNAVDHLATFADDLQKQNDLVAKLLDSYLNNLDSFKQTSNSIEVNYDDISNMIEPTLQQMMQRLMPVSLTKTQLFEVVQLLQNQRKPQGKIQLGNGFELQKVYQKVKIKKIKSENKTFREKTGFMVVLNHWYDLPSGKSVAIFNSEKVPNGNYLRQSYFWLNDSQFPLQIRPSEIHDRVKLKGGGHKQLRRILIDHKVNNEERKLMFSLVDCHNEVLSILGIQEGSTNKSVRTNLYVLLVK